MNYPEIEFSIEKISVVAKSRMLKATYSLESIEEYEWIPDLRTIRFIKRQLMSEVPRYHVDGFDWAAFHKMSQRERDSLLSIR